MRVIVALLLALIGCNKSKAAGPDAPKPDSDVVLSDEAIKSAHIHSAAVKSAPLRTSVVAAGMIEFAPNRVARIGPLIDGRVVALRVDPGQRVKPGDVLAVLQSAQVGGARADYAAAQLRAQQAEREKQRQLALADGGATSQKDLMAALTQQELADLEQRNAAERLRAVGGYTGGLVLTDGGVAYSPSSAIPVTTPLGGVVLDINARVGQPVGSTDTLFVVGEIDRVWLMVDVYERDLASVHGGDEVHAAVVAYPDRTFNGVVDYVGGTVDPVRRATVARIVLDNPDSTLRPGMTVTARVLHALSAEGGAPMTLWVPRTAVTAIDGLPIVFVEKKPGHYDMRPIEKGVEVEGEVEVKQGLSLNDIVVVDGTFVVKSELLREQMGKND